MLHFGGRHYWSILVVMKHLWSLQEKEREEKIKIGQYWAASDPSRAESILDSQKAAEWLTSGAKATLTTVTKLPDFASARRGPANLPDKLIATRVHPQSLSRRFNYEYKAVV